MNATLLILTSVTVGVVGQLVLKSGVARLGALSLGQDGALSLGLRVFGSPRIVGGLALYGVSMLCWLAALSQVELGYAYPFLSLSYVLILFASWAFFREEVTLLKLVGVLAICFGVFAVAGGL